eukprot:jgi/Hompol1/2185/HPOL_005879-RA
MSYDKANASMRNSRLTEATRWIAPERSETGITLKTDIFAFAMTCFEILSGEPPFKDVLYNSQVEKMIRAGERPGRPEGVPDALWELIEQCWHMHPDERPDFKKIADRLEAMPRSKEDILDSILPPISVVQQIEMMPVPFDGKTHEPFGDSGFAISAPEQAYRAVARSSIDDIATIIKMFPDFAKKVGLSEDGFQQVSHVCVSAEGNDSQHNGKPVLVADDATGETTELRIISTSLNMRIPRNIGQLLSLTTLVLSKCELSGPIPHSIGQIEGLVHLDLSDNPLTGELIVDIMDLKQLRVLNLSKTKLNGQIPDEINELEMLEELILDHAQFSGELPESIGDLSRLRVLTLEYNKVSGSLPESIGNLAALERLNISNNELSGSLPESISNLVSLREIDLSGNGLTGEIIEAVFDLVNLCLLRFNDNGFFGTISPSIANLASIEKLGFGNNRLEGSLPIELGECRNLTALDLHQNAFTGQIPAELSCLTNLVELNLARNQLSGTIPPAVLQNLVNLKYLDLSKNELEGPIPEEIVCLTSLVQFNAHSNRLSGSVPEGFATLPNLKYVVLHKNPMMELPSNLKMAITRGAINDVLSLQPRDVIREIKQALKQDDMQVVKHSLWGQTR